MAHTDTFLFTIRLFFSILVVKKELRATLLRREDLPSGFYSEGVLAPVDGQELSQRSPKLYSKSVKFNLPSESEEVIHAIIIPNYQEDIETLRLTLDVLASHPRAGLQYKVCSFSSTAYASDSDADRYTWQWSKRNKSPLKRHRF